MFHLIISTENCLSLWVNLRTILCGPLAIYFITFVCEILEMHLIYIHFF